MSSDRFTSAERWVTPAPTLSASTTSPACNVAAPATAASDLRRFSLGGRSSRLVRDLARAERFAGARVSWDEALGGADERLEVVYTFTRARPSGWKGYARRVDREMLCEVAWAPERRPRAYVCGPTAFVEAVANGLIDLGYPAAEVRTERFGPSGG